MSRVKFGKIQAKGPMTPVQTAYAPFRDTTARADVRFMVWVAAGLLTGFVVAAIECL